MITKSDFVDSRTSAFFCAINPIARRGSYTLPTEVSCVSTDTKSLARLATQNPPQGHAVDAGPGTYRIISDELLIPALSPQSSTSISRAERAEVSVFIREMLLRKHDKPEETVQEETKGAVASRLSQKNVTLSGKLSLPSR